MKRIFTLTALLCLFMMMGINAAVAQSKTATFDLSDKTNLDDKGNYNVAATAATPVAVSIPKTDNSFNDRGYRWQLGASGVTFYITLSEGYVIESITTTSDGSKNMSSNATFNVASGSTSLGNSASIPKNGDATWNNSSKNPARDLTMTFQNLFDLYGWISLMSQLIIINRALYVNKQQEGKICAIT